MVLDTVIEDDSDDTRTHKILNGVVKACDDWDLGKPIWLDSNIQEFQRLGKPAFIRITLLRVLILIIWRSQIIEE